MTDFATTWRRGRKVEASTHKRYAITLRQHLLDGGAGEPSVVKAYQLLRAIMDTAVDDELIQRNPCRTKGPGTYDVPERPELKVTDVFVIADTIGPHWRALALLTAFTALRLAELAVLRRWDVDLANRLVRVQRNQAELNSRRLYD
ncbi:hypothetical protein ACFVXH_23635 [Kitasatospora sp. NPDC058184]|uniref:hypothetical protein n=1 Tax=Kitasatospora sp. NPDC058184 TaxID=3346370 RepID=UPI0036DE2F98